MAGSSAGANLAIRAVCEGETGLAGLICRYGYYGDLAPGRDFDMFESIRSAAVSHAVAQFTARISAFPRSGS